MAINLRALVCKVDPLYKELDFDALKDKVTSPAPDCGTGLLVPDSSALKAPPPTADEYPPTVHAVMPVMSGYRKFYVALEKC